MKKTLLLPLLLILSTKIITAQQDPQFTHYNFSKLAFNPAYAGMRHAICFTGLFREQWTGFPGNPRNYLFSGDMYIPSVGGVGLTAIKDQLGFDNTNIVKGSYSFHIPSLGVGTLGIGLEVAAIQKSLGNKWIYNQAGDAHIPLNGASKTIWDMGLGVFYEIERSMYIGISTLHIPKNDFKKGGVTFFSSQMHHYLTAGCEFYLSEYSITIKPSLLAKTDAASTQIDFTSIFLWQEKIWIGGTYRLTDAVAILGGYQQKIGNAFFKGGYSYDITTSTLKDYSAGSHEIFVSYCVPVPDKPRKTSWSNTRELW